MDLLCLFLAVAAPPQLEWREYNEGDRSGYALYQGSKQIGAYSHSKDLYYPLNQDTGEFGPPCPAPLAIPQRRNFGVQLSEISRKEKITLSGNACSHDDALIALTSDNASIPLSKDKYRIVIVSKSAAGAEAERQINECLSEKEKQTTIVQSFGAEDWKMRQSGYEITGDLGLWFLRPDGEVIVRSDGLPAGAAAFVEETRIRRPDYRPERDPVPDSLSRWFGRLSSRNLVVVGLVVVLVFVFALSRRSP